MGLSFMSITITRMLLRLRKRAKPDLDPTISQDMELATFRVAIPAEQVCIYSGAWIGLMRKDATMACSEYSSHILLLTYQIWGHD